MSMKTYNQYTQIEAEKKTNYTVLKHEQCKQISFQII